MGTAGQPGLHRVPVQNSPHIKQMKQPQQKSSITNLSPDPTPNIICESERQMWKSSNVLVHKDRKAEHRFTARTLGQSRSNLRWSKKGNGSVPGKGDQHPVASALPLAWCTCSTRPQHSCYPLPVPHLT